MMRRGLGLGLGSFLIYCSILLTISLREGLAASDKGKCDICKGFVKSFEEGLKSTENSNFAGGDTRWEEEKLGSYANSEVRFVEILDGVCKDYECHKLLEENEEHLERWWFKLRQKKPDLKQWFCHVQLDVCCPPNTFGPTCKECPGGVDDPCGGNGKCEGTEEKDGSGKCSCNYGYRGESCSECDKGFYDDEEKGCSACHSSCKDDCSGRGAAECEECAGGYEREEEGAECRDVNECEEKEREMEEEGEGDTVELLCEEGRYCFNTQGSYRCNDCDRSCEKGCLGPGPARCVLCAAGYFTSKFNVCKDINECEGGEGWEGDPVTCQGLTYCDNTPGSYQCRACHVACHGGCHGAGPTKCEQCKDGFKIDDGECKDVNECDERDESPCDAETEKCSNLIGSFKCNCKNGLVRVEGKCTDKIAAKEKDMKKKQKKKKKRSKQSREGVESAAELERRKTESVTAEREGEGRKTVEDGESERRGGEEERREGRETVDEWREEEGRKVEGEPAKLESHDNLQKPHDKSNSQDQNLSQGSGDQSHDTPINVDQSATRDSVVMDNRDEL